MYTIQKLTMDYPLYSLSEDQFEKLVISICQEILGIGTTGFTSGKDGGRDGRFSGTAQLFPSKKSPWSGKFIIQAKHTNAPYSSCSEKEFTKIIQDEILKIHKLKEKKEIDYYLIFTNRRLTGGADSSIRTEIKNETGIESYLFANELIQSYLQSYPNIAKQHGLFQLNLPLDFSEKDFCEVINDFPSLEVINDAIEEDKKWVYISKEEKNELNKLSKDYFNNVIKGDIKYFLQIQNFLEDPANFVQKEKYKNTIYDLQSEIMTYKDTYNTFEEIFSVLYKYVLERNKNELYTKRRLIRLFLHYMYFTCDIGRKE